MFIVFDLDGTLALNEHRQHFVERPVGQKDWKSFFAHCGKDDPYQEVIHTLKALQLMGDRIEIWSGRTDEVIAETSSWLVKNGLGYIPFRCRKAGDRTADHILKKKWLDESPEKPSIVFDDRDSVVEMWRSNGVRCFQVAKGEF